VTEQGVLRRVVMSAFALAGLAVVFSLVLLDHVEPAEIGALAGEYIRLAQDDLGVANVVTGILLAYRSFDTVGEVAVLFMVAASLVPLLASTKDTMQPTLSIPETVPGEIIHSGHLALMPLIAVYGAYVVFFGHLSAGGGFQGGAIIATAIEFYMIAHVTTSINIRAFSAGESVAGVLFVLAGVLGLVLAGGFLDPRFLPVGEAGQFLSGGAIMLLSFLLGVKVAAELSVILERFRA